MKDAYIGHESQILGVEEHRLVGGRGDGMRLFEVRNGKGLEFTVSADRCADISRLSCGGANYSYFTVNGYVAPAYYDDQGLGWLKSFTAGFLTTCGLEAVGSPCTDGGETLPLHGRIANTPAERVWWDEDDGQLSVHAVVPHAAIFGRKLTLRRTISSSKLANELTLTDTVTNFGDETSPLMLLYHMNMGYPLLSEAAELYIPADAVRPRDEHAAEDLAAWQKILPPTPGFREQCYYHDFHGDLARAGIYNPEIGRGLMLFFDPRNLGCFTQWKMMGVRDYVMGLEAGNCYPDGRDVMRREGRLAFIAPGESRTFRVRAAAAMGEDEWTRLKERS